MADSLLILQADRTDRIILTKQETAVAKQVAEGYRNIAIARILGITTKSVEQHLNNMYRKLEKVLDFEYEDRQPRVMIALEYLKATGQLKVEDRA